MKVTVEHKKGLNKDLKIFIDKNTMNKYLDEKYEEIKVIPHDNGKLVASANQNTAEGNNSPEINHWTPCNDSVIAVVAA